MKFRNFKDSLSTLGGGVYCAIEGWGILKCENANVLKAGISTKVGETCLTGYPKGTEKSWGILITFVVGADFSQIFLSYTGSGLYIRGGSASGVVGTKWYKYSLQSEQIDSI